jgi:hypothetical protein
VVAIAADFGHGLTLTKDNIVGLGDVLELLIGRADLRLRIFRFRIQLVSSNLIARW